MQHDLATLSREVQALRREVRGQRRRSRMLLLTLVALVALVPGALLAANPFNDLNAGSPHNGNIDAIYNAGITTGCDPNVSYCPTDLVTRQEMASFLARTAGLGDNPPVANAKTAQTATNATQLGGQPASAYQLAGQPIANAANAANAATLSGYAPGALNRVAFSAAPRAGLLPGDGSVTEVARVTLTIPGPGGQAVAVRGTVNLYNIATGGDIIARLVQDDAAFSSTFYFPYQTTSTTIGVTVFAEWVFVAAPGAHTYTLVAAANSTLGSPLVATPTLVATTHPFGATGTPGATEIEPVAPGPAR
ncbi:MAG TPA: hypothetical protein VIL85_08835 [Thermomicrobiales bacterium]